jgi:hypothetical protein
MLINMCQQIMGAALSAFLPTFTKENGFEGANAQIATLAPYGAAMIVRIDPFPSSSLSVSRITREGERNGRTLTMPLCRPW